MHKIIDYLREIGNTLSSQARAGVAFLEREDIFVAAIVILVAFSSFGLGRLSAIEEKRPAVKITLPDSSPAASAKVALSPKTAPKEAVSSGVVASKNGSRYYFPWCGGIERIKKENIVSFATPKEAEQSGYSLAANCAAQ